jgi:hypothetical protein
LHQFIQDLPVDSACVHFLSRPLLEGPDFLPVLLSQETPLFRISASFGALTWFSVIRDPEIDNE